MKIIIKIKGFSILLIPFFLFFLKIASAQKINIDSLYRSLEKAQTAELKTEIALELVKHYNRNDPDSTAFFLKMAKQNAEKTKSKALKANVLLSEANRFQNIGRIKESIEANQKAILIYEELKDNAGLAKAYSTLGLAFKKSSGDENEVAAFTQKALAYEYKALAYFKLGTDKDGLLRVYSNIGIIQRDMKQFKEAEKTYLEAIELAQKMHYEGYSLGVLKANYSQIFLDYYKDYPKAISILNEALDNYGKNGVRTSMEHAYRNISYNYSKLGQYDKAIEYGKKAVDIAEEVKDPYRQIMAYAALHHAQEKAGLYKASLENLNHLNTIEHEILNKEKASIIAEMDVKFETLKKESEIKVLSKTNELNKWRIVALLVLLAALGLLFYSFNQKRKREKLLLEKEKIIERERRKIAEIELDAKKKELTTKVLQLARKNEFLNNLENEIEHLKNNVDDSVNKTSNRISRMIKRDIDSDVQWDQFSLEFSSVHQGFLSALTEKFGNFSKSEIRLISLLKMNMNSKEIADILGISDEGIKKARYRLRQKMNLEDSDLQSFLLGFS
ncbi:hypothetical protein EGI22_04540 [Lacihabitans sp. LS3-19]|uniref:tetratricopeptide repeat protein n=1 Tax=Lacihabitans sp. LS3-19 TaxID=2487335 RepID=UPI0020CC66CA|nr:tetratricopeptide repeat protein [Lacihabitans sp. LS3-19]MCP9767166.1 hypothetical protein [Lacihabitans sp. LS3-19]